MTIHRQDIATHLTFGVKTGFLKGQNTHVSMRAPFVREAVSDGKSEDYSDLGAVPMPVDYNDMVQVRGTHEVNLTITNKDYEITLGITHNAINDDRVDDLQAWALQAGRNFEKHKDKLSFLALDDGDGSTYGLCYDGQNMFSASHADSGAEYTTAQDNQYALPLSIDNFETVWVAGQGFLDGRGEPVDFDHNLIITSPTNKRLAFNIADNPDVHDTADNEKNPWSGALRPPIFSTHLDTTAWFVVAADEIIKPVILQTRQEPRLVMWDDEKLGEGGVRFFKFHGRYNVGYGDWRTVLMGNT